MLGVVVYHVSGFHGRAPPARGSATRRGARGPRKARSCSSRSRDSCSSGPGRRRAPPAGPGRTACAMPAAGVAHPPAYWFALAVLAVWPGHHRGVHGDWWRYCFFLQLYDTEDAGPRHPRRLDALRRGHLLSRAAASCAGAARGSGRRGQLARAGGHGPRRAGDTGRGGSRGDRRTSWRRAFSASRPGSCSAWCSQSPSVAGRDRFRRAGRPARAVLSWARPSRSTALIPLRHQPGGLLGHRGARCRRSSLTRSCSPTSPLTAIMLLLLLALPSGTLPDTPPQRVLAGSATRVARIDLLRRLPLASHARRAPDSPRPCRCTSKPTGSVSAQVGDGLVTPIALALTLAASCAVATLSYRFIELPFLRRKES